MSHLDIQVLILLSKPVWFVFLLQVLSLQLFILVLLLFFVHFKCLNLFLESFDFTFLNFYSFLVVLYLVLHVHLQFLEPIDFWYESRYFLRLAIIDGLFQITFFIIELLVLGFKLSDTIHRVINLFLDLYDLIIQILELGIILRLLLLSFLKLEQLI